MAIQEARQDGMPSRNRRGGSDWGTPRSRDRREATRWSGDGGGIIDRIVDVDEERLASGLGWFSIGLGLAQLAQPRSVAQMIGVRDDDQNCRILRAVGMRELACGIGILTQSRPAGWVWARVGGDVMDLALLGAALTSDRSVRSRIATAAAAVARITVLDFVCGQRLSERDGSSVAGALAQWTGGVAHRSLRVTKAVTIGRPAEELYRFWRDIQNLPRVMKYLESVEPMDERRSHWKAKAPLGRTIEWDSEITEDRPNERIAWRSLEGADLPNSGSVFFEKAPGNRGTVVRVELQYEPPGGIIGATFAKLLGREPGQQLEEDLRAFKQLIEVGEIVQSDATVKGWGPARPPAEIGARR